MTVLRDSSARLAFSSRSLLATTADDEEESLLVWEKDLRLDLAWWCMDLMLGPQQLRYMTVLRDSSARLAFSSLSLLATTADDEEESFLVWEKDLRLDLAWWCKDLMV
ncbi:hypothetical protein RJ639_037447 [Escallonia herrerae]|uniref:Uncharacterized protein n=1 Tax=Escallonia herrerae TaxID=1293975 RepID=A0AA88WWB6_9ASTE|nr:hypothetical protein RJ639_037447 [Escallonia herrerae]